MPGGDVRRIRDSRKSDSSLPSGIHMVSGYYSGRLSEYFHASLNLVGTLKGDMEPLSFHLNYVFHHP